MQHIDNFANWLWGAAVFVLSSLAFAVFAGAMTKHSLDVLAGKHRWFGLAWKVRMVAGVSLAILAYGAVESFGLTGWTASAVANLIGFAGIEIVLQIALLRLRALGFVNDLPQAEKAGETQGKTEG